MKSIDINNAFYAQQLKLYFSSFYEKRKLILVSVYYHEINYEPIYYENMINPFIFGITIDKLVLDSQDVLL